MAHRLTGWNAIKDRAERSSSSSPTIVIKEITARIKALGDERELTLDDVDHLLRKHHSAAMKTPVRRKRWDGVRRGNRR